MKNKIDAVTALLVSALFAVLYVLEGASLGHGHWRLAFDCFVGAYYLALLYRLGTFKGLFS